MRNKTLDIWIFVIMICSLSLEFFCLGLFIGTLNWLFFGFTLVFGIICLISIYKLGDKKIVLRS